MTREPTRDTPAPASAPDPAPASGTPGRTAPATCRAASTCTASRRARVAARAAVIGPGLLLASGGAALALAVNTLCAPVSALLVAILLGVLARNLGWVRAGLEPGLAVASKRWLRLGIVLLGFQVVLTDIARLGWGVLTTVAAVVVLGIMTAVVAGKALGVPPVLRLLIGCGFSICGAAAVAGMDGAVEAEEEDVATAIALVVLFGTGMILLAPALVGAAGVTAHAAGVWQGASIHEVAQVVAAAGITGGDAVRTAVVVKLARVLMLAPVIAGTGLLAGRLGVARAAGPGARRPPLVPLFVAGFVLAACVATLGVLPVSVLAVVRTAQVFLLAAAMFGLGCGVRLAALRAVGLRPFVLGAVVTVVVGAVAALGAWLAGVR